MKYQINKLLFLVLLLIVHGKSFSYPKDSVAVKVSIKKSLVTKFEDLKINIKIESHSYRSTMLPKNISWGYLTDSSGSGYFSLQLQKKAGQSFENVKGDGRIDNLPIDEKLDTLYPNKAKTFEFFIGLLYPFEKGEYRIRVLCFMSSNNDTEDKYSNWFYFKCNQTLVPKM